MSCNEHSETVYSTSFMIFIVCVHLHISNLKKFSCIGGKCINHIPTHNTAYLQNYAKNNKDKQTIELSFFWFIIHIGV